MIICTGTKSTRKVKEMVNFRSLMISRSVRALDTLGLVYFHLGRVSDSINMYEEIQKLAPDNAESLVHYVSRVYVFTSHI